MNWFGKKIQIPDMTKKVELEVANEIYSVRWTSRFGDYSFDTRAECEFFRNKEEAMQFEIALKEAFKLIRCSRICDVKLKKEDYK